MSENNFLIHSDHGQLQKRVNHLLYPYYVLAEDARVLEKINRSKIDSSNSNFYERGDHERKNDCKITF